VQKNNFRTISNHIPAFFDGFEGNTTRKLSIVLQKGTGRSPFTYDSGEHLEFID
jgi:hypothetical protein